MSVNQQAQISVKFKSFKEGGILRERKTALREHWAK